MARQKLSTSLAERAASPERGVKIYTDTEMAGFYLKVTAQGSKIWFVQRRIGGKPCRKIIGRYPDLNGAEAREEARKALGKLGLGIDPAEERRRERARSVTLRQAIEMVLAAKPHSPRTAADYWAYGRRYMKDWLDKPLRELGEDRAAVRDRHARIAKNHGKTVADYTMRIFRAAYRRARRQHPDLPEPPTVNIDFSLPRRRKVELDAKRLLAWGRATLALKNPVRRDAHLFMLLTGMRRSAACEARVEHINVKAAVLHVPNPKGGTSRAFDLPLSRPLLDLVRWRVRENEALYPDTPWLFPARSKRGHLYEVKDAKLDGLTGHALRHAFTSLASEVVPIAELKLLLNHKINDVTFGYMQRRLDRLRDLQERASARILEAVGMEWTPGSWPPALASGWALDGDQLLHACAGGPLEPIEKDRCERCGKAPVVLSDGAL